jgi:DNA-binding GntR family transcriptional regulator
MPIAETAYVDESLRVRDGLYVLAAVIVADNDTEHQCQALRALLHRGQRRLHWRDESPQRRSQIIDVVRQLPHTGAVVIAIGMAPKRQERARRKCIERMLAELTGRGIASVVFERRHEELDARDRALVTALKRQRWQPAADEPLLWLPDIAAGAAALAAIGDTAYWDALATAFTLERFTLT